MATLSRETLKKVIISLNRHMDWRKEDPDRCNRYSEGTDEEWEKSLVEGLERAIDAEGIDEFIAKFPDEIVAAAQDLGVIEAEDDEEEDDGYDDDDDDDSDDDEDGDDDSDDGDASDDDDEEDEDGDDSDDSDSDDDDSDEEEGLEAPIPWSGEDSVSERLSLLFSALADDTVEVIVITKTDWKKVAPTKKPAKTPAKPKPKAEPKDKPAPTPKKAAKKATGKSATGSSGDLVERMKKGGDLESLEARKNYIKKHNIKVKKNLNWESPRALHWVIANAPLK